MTASATWRPVGNWALVLVVWYGALLAAIALFGEHSWAVLALQFLFFPFALILLSRLLAAIVAAIRGRTG